MSKIINTLTDIITEHLCSQVKSGVDLVQIFDTHFNVLDYFLRKYSTDPIRKICKELKKGILKYQYLFFQKI